jgi:sarcosine oxidase subunit delta
MRPAQPERCSDQQWAEYLFYRDNPKGLLRERWVHSYGCRQWFVVTRDTVTHDIVEVSPMGTLRLPSGSIE